MNLGEGLTAIIIVGIITLGIYRLFELFVRKKERMMIIEKINDNLQFSNASIDLNLPFFQKAPKSPSWALKISLLLIGVGLGVVIAFILENVMSSMNPNEKFDILYFACISIFGGIGLLSAYFVEQKNNKSV